MKKISDENMSQLHQITIALLSALIGGFLFSFLKFPIPWLLGPMTAVLIVSNLVVKLHWPIQIRNTGLIVVGYSIGLTFTRDTLITMTAKLPSMALMTILLIFICTGMAFLISRITDINFPTALTSSIPGGLSQIITFAEETKGIDITTVTFFQVIRVIMIIFFVPFLIFSPLFSKEGMEMTSGVIQNGGEQEFFPKILLFAAISVIAALIGKKINLPTAFLLGPILVISFLNVSGVQGPPLPSLILDISQFMIGGYIGLLLKPEKLKHKAKIIPVALFSSLMLVCISLGMSFLLMWQYHFSPITSFLSLAPGGADQMGIIGHELEADVSMITGYQLFRILFIFFAVPPLLKLILGLSLKKKELK
ncbi:AbrB family transcriptional regulator [Fictibacillus phosphorivorans]|uniref:AbrB family transcriptional regulator n=1 Tax=Fictibacillus phosphorivorans TaxID=1221500 RepID=UPI00203AB7F8|nr:AbrB family transcriptional regulator [Fictibacillus phosphorivorans]MCM3719350.1 AbrB family transcriptional regulator [Fictibacillus phosphorivorans]MCM3776971.1 AbrB family transcriptional regulator [Fictibacillus phosphorivorans]